MTNRLERLKDDSGSSHTEMHLPVDSQIAKEAGEKAKQDMLDIINSDKECILLYASGNNAGCIGAVSVSNQLGMLKVIEQLAVSMIKNMYKYGENNDQDKENNEA